MLYSEMVVTGALLHGDAASFLRHTDDAPCAFQLGGNDPQALARSAELVEQAGYQQVNLNCGCPSDRVQVGKIGACLMAEPQLVASCYQAMSEAVSIPVSIKSRIGIDDQDDYGFFTHFVATLHAAGCRIFIVHARKAMLQGLSPKENRDVPPLKYDYVFRAMEDYPDALFILNGGIRTLAQIAALRDKVQGVMLGRAPYANPFLLAEIEQQMFGTALPDRMAILMKYRDYIEEQMALGEDFKHMGKHLLGYFSGIPGARHFRRHLSETMVRERNGTAALDDALRESRVADSLAGCAAP